MTKFNATKELRCLSNWVRCLCCSLFLSDVPLPTTPDKGCQTSWNLSTNNGIMSAATKTSYCQRIFRWGFVSQPLLDPEKAISYQSSNAAKHGHIRRTMLVMGFIGYTIPSVWWRTWLVWATGRRLLSPSMKHLVQPLSAAMARCSAVEVLEISGLGISAVVVWLLLAIRAEFSHGLKSISCALFSHLLVF